MMTSESVTIAFNQTYPPLPRLSFRSIARQDIPALKALQDILFPIKYSDSFYESLFAPFNLTYLAFDCGCDASVIGQEGCPKHERVPGGKCQSPQLVAVATGRINSDRGVACRRQTEGYITTLGVAPAARKSGLGSFMLAAIVNLLLGASCVRVTLHVKEDNDDALRMYARFGFRKIEHLIDHYLIDGQRYNAFTLAYSAPSSAVCRIL
jgi:ribosomal protein S18 acetylase RimI-like enzyme